MDEGEEWYVELEGGGALPNPNSQMLEIINNLHQEMVQLRNSN